MQESIRLDAGIKRILINDGPDFLEFNPTDVIFIEKFYKVIGEFQGKVAEYQARANLIEKHSAVDENQLPKNLDQRLEFIKDVCEFTQGRIDYLFGEGTSQKLFHGVESLQMIEQFFLGLIPFIQRDRLDMLKKYAVSDDEPADGSTAKHNRHRRAQVAGKN